MNGLCGYNDDSKSEAKREVGSGSGLQALWREAFFAWANPKRDRDSPNIGRGFVYLQMDQKMSVHCWRVLPLCAF